MSQADKDGNARVTREELAALSEAWFDRLDPEKAGKLTQEQFTGRFPDLLAQGPEAGPREAGRPADGKRAQGGPGGGPARFVAPAFFAAADGNKDGALTRDEWKALFGKWFDEWDAGKKGFLDEGTLREGLIAALPGGPGRGGPGDAGTGPGGEPGSAFPGGGGIGATGVDDPGGARLTAVDATGRAYRFGLRQGDVVARIDGQAVKGAASFRELMAGIGQGAAVSIAVLRDGKEVTVGRAAGRGGPGGGGPGGFGPGGGGRGGPRPGGLVAGENLPLPADESEKRILSVLDELNKKRATQRPGLMNVPLVDGRILRAITEATNAKVVVELGTDIGYSGIWFCLALRTTGGKLITHEIDDGRAAEARENFTRAGVDQIATVVLGNAHETVSRIKEPIDIVFLDADKAGYTDYLVKLLPLVRPGGLILTSNTDISPTEFIKKITTDPELETIHLQAQAGTASDTLFQGITVTLKKRTAGGR